MAFRIAKPETDTVPKGITAKRPDYLAWLHSLPCAVTGMVGVEAAHLSYASPWHGHYGRGKGHKVPDRWALPLASEIHRRQHSMNEREFWQKAGINPHELALALWGIYSDFEGHEAVTRATARIMAGIASASK